jgi:uncharacterized protein (TIGR02302 family)
MLEFKKLKNLDFLSSVERKRLNTLLIMLLEQITLSFWRPLIWVCLFISITLLNLPSLLGYTGYDINALLFVAGLLYLLFKGFKKFRWPKKNEINRRLEKASNLKHRPLDIENDQLANPGRKITTELWNKHLLVLDEIICKLKSPRPRPLMSGEDPNAIRFFVFLLLFISIIVAGPSWKSRINTAIEPLGLNLNRSLSDNVFVWITPPEYTGYEQLVYQNQEKNVILQIPEESMVKIRVNGGIGTPAVTIGNNKLRLEKLTNNSYGIETKITEGNSIDIYQSFLRRASIKYEILKDKPPIITMSSKPETLPRGELQFFLTVEDDYGVQDLYMSMDIDPLIEDAPLGNEVTETRAVISPPNMAMNIEPVYDFSWHTWAGLPAIIKLKVTDFKGQESTVEQIPIVLPEREFKHPVAKTLIESRQKLAWNSFNYAPITAFELGQLLAYPENFQHKIVPFLSINSMAIRLSKSPTLETVSEVIPQLWDTAINIEEGDLSLAARNLRDAVQKLEQALKDPNVSEEELSKLTNNLREAMNEYFTELAREISKNMSQGSASEQMKSPNSFAKTLTPETLSQFLDQLHSEAITGDKKSAREMLSQLQRLMDQITPSTTFTIPKHVESMLSNIGEMQELIKRQQKLLDLTIDQHNRMMTSKGRGNNKDNNGNNGNDGNDGSEGESAKGKSIGTPPIPGTKPLTSQSLTAHNQRVEQDSLRYILGQLMMETDEKFGGIPKNMSEAENEMRKSAQHMAESNSSLSIPHQREAIEQMQESMQEMSKQILSELEGMKAFSMGINLDPLGRSMGGDENLYGLGYDNVEIPDEAERNHIHELLKTLRKRSGELHRPKYERDYYNRLLKQF